MAWRGSTGQLDMPGWSSTQSSLSSYSRRFPGAVSGHSGSSYTSPRTASGYSQPMTNGSSGYSHTSSVYQPSKYGLTSESAYDNSLRPTENGYSDKIFNDKVYGYTAREFDLEPYRSPAHRGTDYSSDTGRGPATRRPTDYPGPTNGTAHSNIGGYSRRQAAGKSSEFELEIPSPDTGGQDEDGEEMRANFTSPHLYRGSLSNLTLMQRNSATSPPTSKTNDLTQWQQAHRNGDVTEHSVKGSSSSRAAYYKDKSYRDYGHEPHSDSELTSHSTHNNHLSQHHHPSQLHHRGNVVGDHPSPSPPPDVTPPRSPRTLDNLEHLGMTSPVPLSRHGGLVLSPRYSSTSNQMNQIRGAATAIIRDKDAIIDELKDRVMSLEEMIKDYDVKLRRGQTPRAPPTADDGTTYTKLQEMEYRNGELRTDLAKLKVQKDSEVEELEIKLGGVESEVVHLKSALRKAQPNLVELKEKLLEKDEEIEELKRKHETSTGKIAEMERYLTDLPSWDEYNKNDQQLASCTEELQLKKEQMSDLENTLQERTKELADKSTIVQQLESEHRSLGGKMRELSVEVHRIKSQGDSKVLAETQEELAETQEINEKVTRDLEKAKKDIIDLLEWNHRMLSQAEVKHLGEVRALQERLGHEEEAVKALREEVRLKEQQVAKLKHSLKDFANKNQDLMDEGLILKEQLRHYEQAATDETQKLQRRFVREMSLCFADLQSVVQILVQQAEGKDPNISLLLGPRATLDDEGAAGACMSDEHSLKHWFAKLRDLHGEVEKVRNSISNKYAKDMSDNLNCATQ